MVQPQPGDLCVIGNEDGRLVCSEVVSPPTGVEIHDLISRSNAVIVVHLWIIVALLFGSLALSFLALVAALGRRRP